ALQALPRLSLSEIGVSKYQVRATSQPDGLATIEAIYYALKSLEPVAPDDLLLPFQTMIQRQLAMAESQKKS
ncbi:MAG: DTW domain-containing protein, partial [Gammaproteobacteria bacterium]|nr:DTW domain-containing protein [Gammaproteobacteria bacterium]